MASLQADQVLAHATELILQLDPIFPTLDQTMRMFEQIATQIAPALGWQRAMSAADLDATSHPHSL